jgi:hypothetical protein
VFASLAYRNLNGSDARIMAVPPRADPMPARHGFDSWQFAQLSASNLIADDRFLGAQTGICA